MTTQARLAIGVLAVLLVVLIAALAISLAYDDNMHNDSGYSGMVSAMHDGNLNGFMASMREAMNDEDYAAMTAHMQAHQAGSSMMDDAAFNGMMHRMMDEMMSGMMNDSPMVP